MAGSAKLLGMRDAAEMHCTIFAKISVAEALYIRTSTKEFDVAEEDHTTEERTAVAEETEYSTFVPRFAVQVKYLRELIALLVVAVIMFIHRS